ncbi:hypothetical protein MMC08_000709 [Hypocenomyce scalaris]|nr:hypothetical protein [Hypocenomyce scalaris]
MSSSVTSVTTINFQLDGIKKNRSLALRGVRSGVTMPSAFAMSEGTLLGLQSSIGVAIENSLDVQRKEEALLQCWFVWLQELYRPDKQTYRSLLLEAWLNEVLHTSSTVNLGSGQGPFKV